ncbi:MAG: NAD(P)/FAD-dependent oxidoreductase [Alphaproteobacteria bacterium]
MKRIVVVGAGFGGMWAALAAARLLDIHGVPAAEAEVVVIAPEPALHVRPRFYEDDPAAMAAPLLPLFRETGIGYVRGTVDAIDTDARRVAFVGGDGRRETLGYDRLVLASGSRLHRPDIPGLADFAFSIDQLAEAVALDGHLRALPLRPDDEARNTVVVIGGGFTGIEIAAELPGRLRRILGAGACVRIVILERADAIGPELGPGPRPVIERALRELGVEVRLGASAARIDADGVVTAAGERIAAGTVVWTAGLRASPLARQIPGDKDPLGRIVVDRDLRAPAAPCVFVAGDAGRAATDDAGNHTLMSCQHALLLGRSAGNNAAADLLGLATIPYAQPRYGTTLDLGPWGAVRCEGWERVVQMAGPEVKPMKRMINSKLIYPPPADRRAAFEAADPVVDVEKLKRRVAELLAAE